MKYLPKSRVKNVYSRKVVALGAVFVLCLVIFSFLDGALMSIAEPLWKSENKLSRSLQSIGGYFQTKRSLVSENMSLKEKIDSLEIKIASDAYTEEKERELLLLLGREDRREGMLASVLIAPPQSAYDTVVIDAGSADSVSLLSRVYLLEGPEIGRVEEVYERSAKVRLLSSSGEKTNAVLERFSVPVVLEGVGAGSFIITLSRDNAVEVGDRILSADVDGELLAVVGKVESSPTDSFKKVYAKSPANIFSIRFVTVSK